MSVFLGKAMPDGAWVCEQISKIAPKRFPLNGYHCDGILCPMGKWLVLAVFFVFGGSVVADALDTECCRQEMATNLPCHTCLCSTSSVQIAPASANPMIPDTHEFVSVRDVVLGRQNFVKFTFHPPKVLA